MEFRTYKGIKYFLHPGKATWYIFKTGEKAGILISNELDKLL